MERRFYKTREVAELLRVKEKTLRCYHSKHALYQPARAGIWHVEHVRILEKVWAGALNEDEGWAFWETEKKRMRQGHNTKPTKTPGVARPNRERL